MTILKRELGFLHDRLIHASDWNYLDLSFFSLKHKMANPSFWLKYCIEMLMIWAQWYIRLSQQQREYFIFPGF